MGRRSAFQRGPDDFKRGRVTRWNADPAVRAAVAAQATYRGNGEHKTYPAPNGEWVPSRRRGKASCWRFAPSDWPLLVDLLRRTIEAGCVHESFRGGFPLRVWVYINGVLHEGRLHNPALGEYHGFPLEYPEQAPEDPDDLLRSVPREQIAIH